MRTLLKKCFFIAAGSAALGLGFLGIFIPVLPTTPFVLLAAVLYAKSSRKLYERLLNHRILGSYINNYFKYRAVKMSTKVGTIIFLWFSLTISIIFVDSLCIRALLALIGIAVSIHIIKLKTLKGNSVKSDKQNEQ